MLNFENTANTQDEFIALVAQVLKSPQVLSAAQSLIARATETLKQRDSGMSRALADVATRQASNLHEGVNEEEPMGDTE